MGDSFKYQLIQTSRLTTVEDRNARTIYKIILACTGLILTILYYNMPIPETELAIIEFDVRSTVPQAIEPKIIEDASNTTIGFTKVENYFVYTSRCHMLEVNPFSSDVMKIYERIPYKKCGTGENLISVNYDRRQLRYILHMNEAQISCCYKPILRAGLRTQADNLYKLLPCSNFHQDFVVPPHLDAIITECRRLGDKKLLQQDAFSFVQAKESNGSVGTETTKRRPSVLLWGIDSFSRMNFQRTMPMMHRYLQEKNWFELQGYNKMGDNTLPNLLAVLTGNNKTRSQTVCRPNEVGGLDACPMLWKDYKRKGYATAYSEDWSSYATFNHLLRGFRNPPTDYYGRPFILAIDKELKKKYVSGIPYCVGRRQYAEYIYDSALQFAEVYRNQSSFGMFWTNSFSHNDFALPSSMDSRLVDYMHELNRTGIFDNSIILFFSDHGMRFGKLRKLQSGFLEERMPVLYIWLPPWFRKEYPQFVTSLKINKNRLTSPYDIHATLKHILELEKPQDELPKPEGCPSCHSVFFEVAESRDCQDAGIDEHWCTCLDFEEIQPSDPTVRAIAEQLIEATNSFLVAQNLTKVCQTQELSKIEWVKRKLEWESTKTETYQIRYGAEPGDILYEASLKWDTVSKRISVLVPEISRLTTYNMVAHCVSDAVYKKFCICAN